MEITYIYCKEVFMKRYAKAGVITAALFSMWGILYPQLCFEQNIIRMVSREEQAQYQDYAKAYVAFLNADAEDITFQWKLAEYVEAFLQEK